MAPSNVALQCIMVVSVPFLFQGKRTILFPLLRSLWNIVGGPFSYILESIQEPWCKGEDLPSWPENILVFHCSHGQYFFSLLNSSPKKTATRKNNFHKGAAETSGRAVRQNKISWHLHERGNRHENKFARKSSTGENTVFEAGGGLLPAPLICFAR